MKESNQNITQKDAFLKYLEKMDLDMLDLILDDSILYFGATKDVFLAKLEYIFNQVHLAGGEVHTKIKQHKKKSNTYYQIVSNLSFANKFIIDDIDGKIVEMYNSKLLNKKDDIEQLHPIEIYFGDDEKADFNPTTEYIMNVYSCTKAYEELINDQIQILSASDIYEWLEKHAILYEEIKDDYLYFKYNKFKSLYLVFEYYAEKLSFSNEAKKALMSINNNFTYPVIDWIEEYYFFYSCCTLHIETDFEVVDESSELLKSFIYSNIYFKGEEFLVLVKFDNLFKKTYESCFGCYP